MRMAQNRAYKEQLKQNIEMQKKSAIDQVKAQADYTKQEKQQQKDLLHIQKQQDYLKNTSMKQMIKTQQQELKQKKQVDL